MSLSAMRRRRCPAFLSAAWLTMALWGQAHAQVAPPRMERADPLDAQVRVPAVQHASALSGYRRLGDDRRIDWKEANETVSRIGGWRAYAREAQQPDSAASAPSGRPTPAPASGAAPAPGGHHKH